MFRGFYGQKFHRRRKYFDSIKCTHCLWFGRIRPVREFLFSDDFQVYGV